LTNSYSKVWLGSHYYINLSDTPEQIQEGIAAMARAGLKLVRIFLQWNDLERQEANWNWELYDVLFAAALTYKLEVVVTLMAVHPPGWLNLTGGPQEVGPLSDPVFWQRAKNYVTLSVQRYATHPALHSWILWNEPSWHVPRDAQILGLYQAHLKARYNGDIAAYNARVYRQVQDFSQVQFPTENVFFGWYAEKVDWLEFSVKLLNQYLNELKSWVRLHDARHPIHTNPHNLAVDLSHVGQSIWEQGRLVDFPGCSAHPSWHSTRFPSERFSHSVALFADLTRSVSQAPANYFWVSELQGGTNIYSGTTYLCPSPQDLELWLWECIGAGAGAVLFWCFNARLQGFEAGEWSLLNQLSESSERLEAVARVAALLEQYQTLFEASHRPSAQVAILYSEASWRLGRLEGQGINPFDPRNIEMGADALIGAYLLCTDLGVAVDFVDEKTIQEAQALAYECLIVPGCTALEDKTLLALQTFVNKGGTLIADGLCGYKTSEGVIRKDASETLLFGTQIEDIQALHKTDVSVQGNDGLDLPLWFLKIKLRPATSTQSLVHFSPNTAAITRAQLGKGQAIRLGTVIFQSYFQAANSQAQKLIQQWLPSARPENVSYLENRSATLILRRLALGERGEILIALNSGKVVQSANIVVAKGKELVELSSNGKNSMIPYSKSTRLTYRISLQAQSVRIFQTL
jgi:beta-galactosidase